MKGLVITRGQAHNSLTNTTKASNMSSFIILYKGKHLARLPARDWNTAVKMAKKFAAEEKLDFSQMDVL